jgi:hypothetical protein
MESYLSLRLGDNSQYSGVLAALVPDYRAKIEEIRIGTNSVQVEIECLARSSENDLIGKLFVRYYSGISITADLDFTEQKAPAEIRDFPRDLLVVLLSRKDGEVVDRRSFLAGSQYVTDGVTIENPERDIEQMIVCFRQGCVNWVDRFRVSARSTFCISCRCRRGRGSCGLECTPRPSAPGRPLHQACDEIEALDDFPRPHRRCTGKPHL